MRDAQKVLNQLVAESDKGEHDGSDATFRDVAERWLRISAADLSPTTVRRYRGLLTKHIYPALGDRPAHKIRTSELDDLYLGLIEQSGLAPATVRQVHAVVRKALGQAVRWGWLRSNPAANTTPPRVPKPTIEPPDVDQVRQLLSLADDSNPAFGRFLHLAVTTGARRGELCALRWNCIDWANHTVTIGRSIVEVQGGLHEKDTKTHSVRRIALDEQTLAVLAEQQRCAVEQAEHAATALPPNGYVFSHDPGGAVPWSPHHVSKAFQRLRSQVGMTGTRLHDLRHFAASRLLAAGVPVRTVSGRLGHANAATTLGVYAHFVEASDRKAADLIASELVRP